jgi:hypothetical protein
MFYLDNKTEEVYRVLREQSFDNDVEQSLIEICNNEDFILDLTGIVIKGSKNILLINVDWGDGTSDKFSKPLKALDTIEWKILTHTYNTTSTSELTIKIIIYNTKGENVKITIPYKILNKSIYDLSTDFKLLQANVSNKNLTQFVMKEGLKNSIIIVSEKNWKDLF